MSRLVGREELPVLLVIGRQVLPFGEMCCHGQDVIEGCAGGFQNRVDALEGVIGLLTNAFTDFPRNRVSPRLPSHEDQIAEPDGGRQMGVGRSEIYLNHFFLRHLRRLCVI